MNARGTGLAVLVLALAALLSPAPGNAQALNAAWDGDWITAQASQQRPSQVLRVARQGAQTRLEQAGQACPLVYDGTVTARDIQQQVDDLRAWQLSPAHWPAGTDPKQLVGLAGEFDAATRLIAGLSAGRYRRARLRGEGCDDADDIFFVLHQGRRLFRVRFPSASLGMDVLVLERRSPP
ncbi:MAG: hypothetical protein KF796_11940 [Ramlibacter sp.]|nr:hypothetical protein [Ramlibacter sp.]